MLTDDPVPSDVLAMLKEARDLNLFQPVTAFTLRSRSYPEPMMLIESLLARGERAMLSGPQKRGLKSHFAIALALHLAAGRDFLGLHVPAPICVWYVDAEMGERAFRERLERMRKEYGLPDDTLHRILYQCLRGLDIDLKDVGRALAVRAAKEGVDLVIIDPITDATWVDENSSVEVGGALRAIQDPLAEADIASLIIHHARKGNGDFGYRGGENARGSGKWGERQDVTIQSIPVAEHPPRVRLDVQARHRPAPDALGIELTATGALEGVNPDARKSKPAGHHSADQKCDHLCELLGDGEWHLMGDLAEELGIEAPGMTRLADSLGQRIERRHGLADRRTRELRLIKQEAKVAQ